MSYVENTLSKGEEIKEVAKLHGINYVSTVLLGLMVLSSCINVIIIEKEEGRGEELIGVIIFFIVWAIYDFLYWRNVEMVVTNKELFVEKEL